MMRAPRFPLNLAVRYRAIGNSEWRLGQTANISSSGVLLEVQHPLKLDTALEFMVALASPESAGDLSEVSCRGRVVRIVEPTDSQQRGFAIAIEQYHFLPPPVQAGSRAFQQKAQ
jgi:hypothetical protein